MYKFPGIQVAATARPSFEAEVVEALECIKSRPVGNQLLEDIASLARGERKVTIVEPAADQLPVAQMRLTPSQLDALGSNPPRAKVRQALIDNATGSTLFRRRGTASEIPWSKATAEPVVNEHGVPVRQTDPDQAFVALAHELIHARHHLAGTLKFDGTTLTPHPACAESKSGKEELRAVGLGKYAASKEPTENAIRAEHGLPRRTTYSRSGNW